MALVLAAAAFTGCLFDNSSDETPGDLGKLVSETPYSVTGNRIITPEHDESVRYCFLDSMIDTVFHIGVDTVLFEITGSTLTISEMENRTETGVSFQWYSTHARAGSGTGLEGDWTGTGRHYRVNSGTLSAEEKASLDLSESTSQAYATGRKATTRFSKGRIATYVDQDFGKSFVAIWNARVGENIPPDSAVFDIEIKLIDKSMVELKGRKSGENVRIAESAEGRTYSSSKAGHTEHRYFPHPTGCPNEYEPNWYRQFTEDNRKSRSVLKNPPKIDKKDGFRGEFPLSL
ncbi:MAG: hypothetical protein ABIQ80_13335 [Fibrobacteria bacterium]